MLIFLLLCLLFLLYKYNIIYKHKFMKANYFMFCVYLFVFLLFYNLYYFFIYSKNDYYYIYVLMWSMLLVGLVLDSSMSISSCFFFMCFIIFNLMLDKNPSMLLSSMSWFLLVTNLGMMWQGFILNWLLNMALLMKNDLLMFLISSLSMY